MKEDLLAFLRFVQDNASRLDGLGKKEIRSTAEYEKLRQKYANLDDLIAEIYKQSDLLQQYRLWISAWWSKRRLEFSYDCRGAQHYEEALRGTYEFLDKHPQAGKRLLYKYEVLALIHIACEEIRKNPWSFADVCRASDISFGQQREEEFYAKIYEAEKEAIERVRTGAVQIRPAYGRGDDDSSPAGKRVRFDSKGNIIIPKKKYVPNRLG